MKTIRPEVDLGMLANAIASTLSTAAASPTTSSTAAGRRLGQRRLLQAPPSSDLAAGPAGVQDDGLTGWLRQPHVKHATLQHPWTQCKLQEQCCQQVFKLSPHSGRCMCAHAACLGSLLCQTSSLCMQHAWAKQFHWRPDGTTGCGPCPSPVTLRLSTRGQCESGKWHRQDSQHRKLQLSCGA